MNLRLAASAFACSLFIGLLALAVPARAAGFDCAKAGNNIEKMICGDRPLSDLDSDLQRTYKTALSAADHAGKKALITEQRNWAQYARAICQDADCLKQIYTARITVLARNEQYIINQATCQTPADASSSECISTVDVRDANWRVASFNQTLSDQKKSGEIVGCTKLLELPGMSTDSNATYGGYCVLEDSGKRTQVKICNDDMIGKFGLEAADQAKESEQDLLNFTNVCPGG
ncbi:DUF1311 domain-containing protein [Rhizobium sp. P38BS-XIX]|nr:DUF1311 domain-containing protein [Rhizobium sp. P38BS-XIX]